MRLDGSRLQVRERLRGEASRNKVDSLVRRVASIVIVTAIIRRNLDRRQSHGPTLQVHHRHRHVTTLDALLNHQTLPIRERIHHRATQLLRVMRRRNTQRRTAIRRLNDDRERHGPLQRGQHVRRAQLAENRLRQRHPARRCKPRGTQQRLSRRLIRREHRLHRRRPHERHAHGLQEGLQGPILTNRTVHERPNDLRIKRLNRARQRCIHVRDDDLIARLRQDVGDATTRTHRHVALVRQAARDDENFRSHNVLLLGNLNGRTRPRPRRSRRCRTCRPFPSRR